MKILHSIFNLNINSGGPSQSTWSLVSGLCDVGIDAEILTYQPGKPDDKMIGKGPHVNVLLPPKYTRFGYSTEFSKYLKRNTFDLYHGHGLWQYPTHAIASFARNISKPYVITPRGMLYPEALKKSALFKKISLSLYQRKDLERATAINATCNQEMEYIRELGFSNPVAVIPNSIDIKIPPTITAIPNKKKQVGFMGRFAPIKNLEILIQAWAETGKNNPDWELVLIGDGESEYKNSLIQLAKKLEINNISFPGFLSGEEKGIALQNLTYLVLPSKSENFGMVIPEALIRKVPVIASKGTPWQELNTRNAGWWIDIGVEPLKAALNEALQTSENKREQMGINGRKLVEENYSIESVAKKMIQLYNWILKDGEKPNFVFYKNE